MNYLYTIWTKPWLVKNNFTENLLYLILSINLIKQYANKITINTDEFGKNVLTKFNLDNIEIIENLNRFNNLNINRWNIPKIYNINEQKIKFCHIDHDVFIYKKIINFKKSDVTAQCFENGDFGLNFYGSKLKKYKKYNQVPEVLINNIPDEMIGGINCGYLEFNNIELSKQWTDFAIKINDSFEYAYSFMDACLVEQFSLYFLYKKYNFNLNVLFDNKNSLSTDGYIHLITEKSKESTILKVEKILKIKFFSEYEKFYNYKNKILV